MTEKETDLRISGMNTQRCDISSHCDFSVKAERDARRLKLHPGVAIKTDPAKVAEIVTGIPKRRRWDTAVSHAVEIVGKLAQTEEPEVWGNTVATLFDGLRDPDRRDMTIQTVEVLYERHVASTRR